MNCQEFDAVIIEAARDQLIDKPRLDEIAAHTSSCRECAAGLADQRTLSAGLGRLAALSRMRKLPHASKSRCGPPTGNESSLATR
jgi:hypothetical protein